MAAMRGLPRLQQSPCHHCSASRWSVWTRPNGTGRPRRQVAVAAGGNADEERDIGAQWSEFVASAKKGMPEVESRERAGARWNDSRAPNWARESFRQQADSRRQSIEKQEMQLLDFWNQDGFFKAAGVSVVVLLAVLLLSGPP